MKEIRINLTWHKGGAGISAMRGNIRETVNAEQLNAILAIIQEWPIVITPAPKQIREQEQNRVERP